MRTWFLACLPLVLLSSIFVFAAYFRIEHGEWPAYGRPDPNTLRGGEMAGRIAVAAALVMGLYAPILLLPQVLADQRSWGPTKLFLACWLGPLTVLAFDPGGILEWYVD